MQSSTTGAYVQCPRLRLVIDDGNDNVNANDDEVGAVLMTYTQGAQVFRH